jgi:hypothetical protein
VRWIDEIDRWIRFIGHEGATANARAVLERRRWEIEQVDAMARRVRQVDHDRARRDRAAKERVA